MAEAAERQSLLPASWRIKLPVFEGPLDLLLHLIRVNEIEISDIPVALICDQYHEYLGLMEELDLDIAGEYIYEAAVLIQLKSRMLLPRVTSEDGSAAPDDPRQELVARLLEYRRLKEAAHGFAEIDSVRSGLFTHPWSPPEDEANEGPLLELESVSRFDLLGALRTVVERYQREQPEPIHLQGEAFSVRAQIDRLLASLHPARAFDRIDDLLALSGRAEAIAAFLAVLELCRLQLVRLHVTSAGAPALGGRAGDGPRILLYRTTRELIAQEIEAITS